MGLRPVEIFLLLQCEDRLKSSESEVYRRQILTTKVYPRTVRVRHVEPRNKQITPYSPYPTCSLLWMTASGLEMLHEISPEKMMWLITYELFTNTSSRYDLSSSLGQAHVSAYRRSLAVSSTTISYSVYVVILGVCLRFKPHWMFQIYKCVIIKDREELTSCSSLIHSHMFPLLDVLYRQGPGCIEYYNQLFCLRGHLGGVSEIQTSLDVSDL